MRIELTAPISIKTVCEWTNGIWEGDPQKEVCALTTDSRSARAGDLFIALQGESDSGERYVADAMRCGAVPISTICRSGAILTSDTGRALLALAASWRGMLPRLKHTIAVTGSVGKTTTKEFLARLLASKFCVHATQGNLNNEIGMPLTILSAPRDTEVLILEMGMNHRGEIARLSRCARPDIAIITRVGTAHIGNFGSREEIAAAKAEILCGMKSGTLLIPYDEPLLRAYSTLCVSICDESAPFALIPRRESCEGTDAVFFQNGDPIAKISLPIAGRAALSCLSFALAAAHLLGISEAELTRCCETAKDAEPHTKILRLGGLILLQDCYNSSAESVAAAIDRLLLYHDRKKHLLLGDIRELGSHTDAIHAAIGRRIAETPIDRVYLFGVYAHYIADAATAHGYPRERIHINTDLCAPQITAHAMASCCAEHDVLIAKASRAIRLERVAEMFVALRKAKGENLHAK